MQFKGAYAAPEMMPLDCLSNLRKLDARATPFQMQQTLCDASAMMNRQVGPKETHRPPPRITEDVSSQLSTLMQREYSGRTRLQHMELTEAARIEMHLQNLNVKRSGSGLALAAAGGLGGGSGFQSTEQTEHVPREAGPPRPRGSDGEVVYEFNNGTPGGMCVYFLKGYCSLGNRCRYVHDHSDPGHIVKITGMPFSATEKDVSSFFNGLKIADGGITFLSSPEGRPTGSAFVEFKERHAALMAVRLDRAYFASNRFVLLYASSKKEREWFLRNPQIAGKRRHGGAPQQQQQQQQVCTPVPSPQPQPLFDSLPQNQQPTPNQRQRITYIVCSKPSASPNSTEQRRKTQQAVQTQQYLEQAQIIQEQQAKLLQLRQQQALMQMQTMAPGPSPISTPNADLRTLSGDLSPYVSAVSHMGGGGSRSSPSSRQVPAACSSACCSSTASTSSLTQDRPHSGSPTRELSFDNSVESPEALRPGRKPSSNSIRTPLFTGSTLGKVAPSVSEADSLSVEFTPAHVQSAAMPLPPPLSPVPDAEDFDGMPDLVPDEDVLEEPAQ